VVVLLYNSFFYNTYIFGLPTVSIKEFLALNAEGFPALDARSEKEFEIGERNFSTFY